MLNEIGERLARLESQINQLIRVGTVKNSYPDRGTVRVMCADADELLSHELPVLFTKTCADKHYHLPDIGEHVLCVFLPFGLEQGFVLGAFYSRADKVPLADQDICCVHFSDDTTVQYNRKAHLLSVNVKGGDVTVDADHIYHNQGTGVVTGECICHYTGRPHGDLSKTVFAGKD